MADSNPLRDPTPADLEMIRDEMAGKPLPRPATQGIADMEARIVQLSAQKKNLLDRLQDGARADDPGWQCIAQLNNDLREATERLGEYKIQSEGLN